MNEITTTAVKFAAIILLGIYATSATAATDTERYRNESEMTHLFVWSQDPQNMAFAGVDLSDKKLDGWQIALQTDFYVVVEGPALKKNHAKIDVDFKFTVPSFDVKFAEILYNEVSFDAAIQATGVLSYDPKKEKLGKPTAAALSAAQRADVDNFFANPPQPTLVPLPGSSVLMLSAMGMAALMFRRERIGKTTRRV